MIVWKKVRVPYGVWPMAGYVGSIEMFRIAWGVLTPDREKPYGLYTDLPGVVSATYAPTEGELKKVAEEMFVEWLDKAGLMVK